MGEDERKVAATCRTCGRQLTLAEFRACYGLGHHCAVHLPAASASPAKATATPKKRRARSSATRRGRRVSESGVVEYSCRAQCASTGVIRRGKLTSDHPACPADGVMFVSRKVAYGPGEVVTLFIKDPEGRALAERAGYDCHE